jgi:PAS domain S-box-containing protein
MVKASPHRVEPEIEPAVEPAKGTPPNLAHLVDRMILHRFAPAAVLTNDRGDILYVSGRTGRYLEPAAGKANLNVFAMAREGLRYELSGAFATALREDRVVTVSAPKVQTNGSTQAVALSVLKLSEPKELRGCVLISFADAPVEPEAQPEKAKLKAVSVRIAELERELQHARDEAQTTREEMQTSQEELKSTNEELQSTNEELQSTNEELTTSKEEMQSMNEELQTVNYELQSKVDELSRTNNDMTNLLNSTDIATLFLDGELRVRRFTTQTAKLIKLIPADAGRSITDIATQLEYPELAEDAREVLRTLVFKEKDVASTDGRWFSVRVLPYRTIDNVIDGVVITFNDVTAAKRLEAALREKADQVKEMADALPNLVWACRADGSCDSVGRRWVDFTGVPEERQLGSGWLEQVHAQDRERVREVLRGSVRSGEIFHVELRIRGKDGAYHWFRAGGAPVRDAKGGVLRWTCIATDVDDLKCAALERSRSS